MALKYEIIEELNLVLAVGKDVISFKELMDHMDQLSKDARYKRPMKKLVDYRKVKSVQLNSSESETFAQKKASLGNVFLGEKCAIVAPIDPIYGVARIHDSLMDYKEPGIEISVFRDWDEAKDWLNIDLQDNEYLKSLL
ncbi:MAG: hypothetical protein JW956_02390 [Calditrichaceae bacterium]|nr:hypothetical protein [Calditrichaceae bacterium]